MNYTTSKQRSYSFTGWPVGQSPVALFDDKRWLECAHSLCVCLDLGMPITEVAAAIEDDGVLHELLHLALGMDICTHNTIAGLREEVLLMQSKMTVALRHSS